MAKALFAEGKDVAIPVADRTYMYIEKNSILSKDILFLCTQAGLWSVYEGS